MSSLCNNCTRDADTGEYFCARIGGWVDKCPGFHGVYRDADRKEDDKWEEV